MNQLCYRMFLGLVSWGVVALAQTVEMGVVPDPLDSGYLPTGRIACLKGRVISATLIRGEVGTSGVSLYNPTSVTRYYQVGVEGLRSVRCTLREGLHIRSLYGTLPADVLPRLSADGVVVVPHGENRQIFLEFETRSCDPGTYKGALTVSDLSEQSKVSALGIDIRVLPVSLPAKHPLEIMTWDCSLRKSKGEGRDRVLAELTSHYVNNFHVLEPVPWRADSSGALVGSPDFSALDKMIVYLRGKGRLLLRCVAPNASAPPIGTDPGRRAYGAFIRALLSHLRDMGLSYDDFALYPLDENISDQYVQLARVIREVDSQALIYADPCRLSKEIGQVAGELKLIDYMQFSNRFLAIPEDRDIIMKSRKQVKILSVYWCPVVQKSYVPQWYRSMGHLAWRYRLDGVGYWTSLWMPGDKLWGNAWNDFKGKASPVTVYPVRNDGSVPSRRWKAFRKGLEDWLICDLVRKRGGGEAQLSAMEQAMDSEGGSMESFAQARKQAVMFLGGR